MCFCPLKKEKLTNLFSELLHDWYRVLMQEPHTINIGEGLICQVAIRTGKKTHQTGD
jgi:hypothetical protein